MQFEPCQLAQELRARASIDETNCTKHISLVEEDSNGNVIRVLKAAAAFNAMLKLLPGKRNAWLRALSVLYRIPVLKQIEELEYRIVARMRKHLGPYSCTPKNVAAKK